MSGSCTKRGTLVDYITGKVIPDLDDEPVRQAVEHLLVDEKGYDPADIQVDLVFEFELDGQKEQGRADLVVFVEGRPFMTLRTMRGSLVTRERESLAISRLAFSEPVPLTVVTNGQDAEILDTASGKVTAEGLAAIPDKNTACAMSGGPCHPVLNAKRREMEGRIYMAYEGFQCPVDCE